MRKTFYSAFVFFLVCPVLRAAENNCPPAISHIVMDSGSYSSRPGVTFRLRHFNATLVPMGKTAPSCYAKVTVVSRAEIFVSNESLTNVFTEKLGGGETKIKDFKIENGVGKVTLTGKITKVVPLNFTISGPVTTDGTSLLLDAGQIKADGIPIKALLGIIGEHLNNVLGMKGVRGVAVTENQISFSPEEVAHLKGHIESVETTADGLTLHYGRKNAAQTRKQTALAKATP